MIAQTLIAVTDVERASAWYQTLLGCTSVHGGAAYDRLAMPGESDFFMQLHAWDAEDHPNIHDPTAGPHGHGVLLWFHVDDFANTLSRIRELEAAVVVEPHVNQNSSNREIWLKDLDGYTVVVSG